VFIARFAGINMKIKPERNVTMTTCQLTPEQARKRIEQEDNLINHRVSWLVGSQSFLLTGFVVLRCSPEYYKPVPNAPYFIHYQHETYLLGYLICLAGFVIALCSSIGVCAAFSAIQAWKAEVEMDATDHLTSRPKIDFFGSLAAFLPGPVLMSFWILLFAEDRPWRFLSAGQMFLPLIVLLICVIGFWRFSPFAYNLDLRIGFRN
jgi:hypothetical protein